MPEVLFDVRWPDGSSASYYSPSLIVEERFRAGECYPVAEFLRRGRDCMRIADARVRARYGVGCTSSRETLARLEAAAAGFDDHESVTLTAFRR